jgi:hypothetical protein
MQVDGVADCHLTGHRTESAEVGEKQWRSSTKFASEGRNPPVRYCLSQIKKGLDPRLMDTNKSDRGIPSRTYLMNVTKKTVQRANSPKCFVYHRDDENFPTFFLQQMEDLRWIEITL